MAQFAAAAAATAAASGRTCGASERSLSVTASKSGLRTGFKARANEREGHANAPRYQRPWTRFTSALSSLIACVSLLPRNTRAFVPPPTCSAAAPDSARTRELSARNVNIAPAGRPVFGDRCPGGKIDTRPRTDQVNVAATKSRCAHYRAPR